MVRKRVIALVLHLAGRAVKTTNFANPLVVGDVARACQVLSDQEADEIFLLNIDPDESSSDSFFEVVLNVSRRVSVPLAIGGGLTSQALIDRAFSSGADKVVVQSLVERSPETIIRASKKYGAQSLVACLDYRESPPEESFGLGPEPVDDAILAKIKQVGSLEVGEILLQSMGRDGTRMGLDTLTALKAQRFSQLPIVVAGGAGNAEHLADAFKCGADGVAVGSLFSLGDYNPIRAKALLRNAGVDVRPGV